VRGRVPKGREPTDNRKRNRRAIAAGLPRPRPSSLLAAYEREKSRGARWRLLVYTYLAILPAGIFLFSLSLSLSLSLPLSLCFILSLLFILLSFLSASHRRVIYYVHAPLNPLADQLTLPLCLSPISLFFSFLSLSLSLSLLPELTLGTTAGDASPTMYCPVTRRQRAAPLRRKG